MEVKNFNTISPVYQIGNKKVVIIHSVNYENRIYDSVLSLLDENNNIECIDKNGGEYYLFEPNFHKNNEMKFYE